jgi:hypothetical protein
MAAGLMTVFWDWCGPAAIHFQRDKTEATSAFYCDFVTLQHANGEFFQHFIICK